MSASSSAAAAASPKAQNGQVSRQGSQAPRVNNGAQSGARKTQNGSPKTDGARRSAQPSANGKPAQNKTATSQPKPKATSGVSSEYLRGRGASVEVANLVAQVRTDLGGYYSEELVFNTLAAHGNNADAARAALTRTYSPLPHHPSDVEHHRGATPPQGLGTRQLGLFGSMPFRAPPPGFQLPPIAL